MLREGFYVDELINASTTSSYIPEAAGDSVNKERLDTSSKQNRGITKTMSHTDQTELVNSLLNNNDNLQTKIKRLESKVFEQESIIKCLKERSDIVQKRSTKITKHMAKAMETSETFENANDTSSKVNIITTFENVYNTDWTKLSTWLAKQFPEISECQLIQNLTSLMKKCYLECIRLAEEQLRQFMLIDESTSIPSPKKEEHQELYALRKKYAQEDNARAKIGQVVLDKVLIDEEIPSFQDLNKKEETKKMLQHFLIRYIDCCWVMVVSYPPLALNFDVVGKQYCKEHFKVYSAKQRIEDESKDTNTVYEVVWPCVYFEDKSTFCAKGDALLISKGATSQKDPDNVECTCFTKADKVNHAAERENTSAKKIVTDV